MSHCKWGWGGEGNTLSFLGDSTTPTDPHGGRTDSYLANSQQPAHGLDSKHSIQQPQASLTQRDQLQDQEGQQKVAGSSATLHCSCQKSSSRQAQHITDIVSCPQSRLRDTAGTTHTDHYFVNAQLPCRTCHPGPPQHIRGATEPATLL